jgi:hypothetical protein
MSPFYEKKEEGGAWKLPLAVGAGLGALTVGWLLLSSPDENRLSGTRIFDQPGGAVAPKVPRAVERREDTGLSMVRVGLAAEQAGEAPAEGGGATGSAAAPATAAPAAASGDGSGAAAPADPYAAAGAAARKEPDAAGEKELAAAGIPVTPSGLKQLGAQKGLLSAVVKKMMDHPRVLKAVLNNQLVVDAVMGRETSRRNCSDPGALKSVLSDPNSPQQRNLFPLMQQALSRPESASVMLSSKLGQAVMDCPSAKAFSSDPSMVMSVAMSNPKALQLVSDPRVASALSSSPQASTMFGQVKSGLGGLGGAQ